MKRLRAASVLLLLLCCGCTPESPPLDPPEPVIGSEEASTEPAGTEPAAPSPSPAAAPTETQSGEESETIRALYLAALTALHDDSLLPSGKELVTEGDIEQNRFAVYDIDGDGREELILEITQADIADRFTAVYDVDADGDLRREVRYEAEVSFWSNGIVIASYPDAAENAADFIPYAVAQYDAELDVYTEFAYVSALDRDILAAHDLLDEYPEEADTSGTGRVYCIRSDNPVDLTEYEAWYAAWHDGLTEQSVPYQELRSENIQSIS